MNIQQIRNATLLLDYAGSKFLIDPMLADQGIYPGLAGTPNSHLANPTVALPVPLQTLLPVDAVIVTHTHLDHWDMAAQALLPKQLPIFTQHEQDRALLTSQGFTDVRLLKGAEFQGITLTQTLGQHGTDDALRAMGDFLGQVCGVVFQHPQEKTLYIAGDTIWNQYVKDTLQQFQPDIVVLNAGDAQILGVGSIIMGAEDVYQVYQAAPQATLIASHMESVNLLTLTRQALRVFSAEHALTDRLLIPEDGEGYTF
ncbi:MBL fold metallo-hydrolase [Hymenobacter sp. BT730]|uniref:MBL fold metallo-hydrolase n=1 Tax=Hymenobacter sp. BT730 TaxID=3063332 RepID=UPI0026E0833F|nr:MBL fold metallo-hydrolase [Hymenobacter sp. BT730]